MKIKFSRIPHFILLLTVILMGLSFTIQSARAHGDEEAMKAFMEPYGKIQLALGHDDLALAQTAAKALPLDKDAQTIAASTSSDDARAAFKHLSMKAISMGADDEGNYVFKCPMVEGGYWLQTSTKGANPYLGKQMLGCGKMLTKADAMKLSAPKSDSMKNMPGM